MVGYNEKTEEVVIISKSGARTLMPSLHAAKVYTEGIWKGKVDRIEVKTVYEVENAN